MPTKIEYCDETWSPVTGCDPDDGYQSDACVHCWARRMSKRLAGRSGYPQAPHNFDVTLHPDRLDQPLHWRKPRRVFVCSMGDLFHEDVPNEFIFQILERVRNVRQCTFLILTKRPERMRDYFHYRSTHWQKPFPNLWLGVTAENQEQADKRIPVLLRIPAAVRFVSYEPGLEQIHIKRYLLSGAHKFRQDLNWVICGCENGPGARPMELDWARSLRDQCQAAGVPFFYKRGSDGSRLLDGRMWEEYPGERGE